MRLESQLFGKWNHFPKSLDLKLCIKISLNVGPAEKNKRVALNQVPWNEVQIEKDHRHSRIYCFPVWSNFKF